MLHTRNFMHTQTLKNEREHWSEPINNPCKDLNSFQLCTLMFVCCKQDVALKELWDTMIAWYMESGFKPPPDIVFVGGTLSKCSSLKIPMHPPYMHSQLDFNTYLRHINNNLFCYIFFLFCR